MRQNLNKIELNMSVNILLIYTKLSKLLIRFLLVGDKVGLAATGGGFFQVLGLVLGGSMTEVGGGGRSRILSSSPPPPNDLGVEHITGSYIHTYIIYLGWQSELTV